METISIWHQKCKQKTRNYKLHFKLSPRNAVWYKIFNYRIQKLGKILGRTKHYLHNPLQIHHSNFCFQFFIFQRKLPAFRFWLFPPKMSDSWLLAFSWWLALQLWFQPKNFSLRQMEKDSVLAKLFCLNVDLEKKNSLKKSLL